MDKVIIEIERQLYSEAEQILNEYGLEVEGVIKSTLKRIVRQGSAEFIFAKQSTTAPSTLEMNTASAPSSSLMFTTAPVSASSTTPAKITRNVAKAIFAKRGHIFDAPMVLSSRNKATGDYWANPRVETVRAKWFLILNDQYQRTLRLFLMDPEATTEPTRNIEINNENRHLYPTAGAGARVAKVIEGMLRLCPRADKPEFINLQIYGDDIIHFEDKISGVEFKPFLLDEVNY